MGLNRTTSILVAALLAAACSTSDARSTEGMSPSSTTTARFERSPSSTTTSVPYGADTTTRPEPTIAGGVPRRVLAQDDDGSVVVQGTPFALRERALPTVDSLPPPPGDERFLSTIAPLSGDPLQRSTWQEHCPVPVDELAYVTVSFIGFDGRPHTGELIVHADHAAGIVSVFEALFAARFPIEQMRIVEPTDLVPPHDGDTNNTSAFVCRRVTGGTRFSEHASGLAIDINPFQNPYVRGSAVVPALARSYGDRRWDRPGMVQPGDVVVSAFATIGWEWGGDWRSLKDFQHFSHNGR